MSYALPFFLGFLTASAGISPPGLINMTAAKMGVDEGRLRAMIFATGATLVILVQTFLAVLFAKFIDKTPGVVILLREIGLGIFIALTIYFLWRGSRPNKPQQHIRLHSKKSRFFLGMLLSALNFFPIPFYVFVSITLASYNYFFFNRPFIYTFVVGAGTGAFFAFWCYIAFFIKLEKKTAFILRNMNYIIASITASVSAFTLINILQYYF